MVTILCPHDRVAIVYEKQCTLCYTIYQECLLVLFTEISPDFDTIIDINNQKVGATRLRLQRKLGCFIKIFQHV